MDTTDSQEQQQNNGAQENRTFIRESMIKHLCNCEKVYYGHLEKKEEELSEDDKGKIASDLLDRSYGLFLAKFGNHLLEEHLCYFSNRSEEESIIVDMHLQQLKKTFNQQKRNKSIVKVCNDESEMEVIPEDKTLQLREKLLKHLVSCPDVHFCSQQIGDPELSDEAKRTISEELLERSCSKFLARFGNNLLEEHFEYFDTVSCTDNYEVQYYLKRLRKTHCKSVSQTEIRNRRFEALKKMVEEGSYFSETEMRSRNPLLYEQLVGKYLSSEERRERLNNIDTANITFVNLLLEQMDREAVKKLKKDQEDAEDDAMEEEDSSSEDEKMEGEDDSEDDNDLDKTLWGEKLTDELPSSSQTSKERKLKESSGKAQEKAVEADEIELSESERFLLLEEFRSSMFTSFLQGKDEFDYNSVDYNSDYDDLEAQGQDEEDKYFDEESSQSGSVQRMSDDDDSLDRFMTRLKPEPTPSELADNLSHLSHQET